MTKRAGITTTLFSSNDKNGRAHYDFREQKGPFSSLNGKRGRAIYDFRGQNIPVCSSNGNNGRGRHQVRGQQDHSARRLTQENKASLAFSPPVTSKRLRQALACHQEQQGWVEAAGNSKASRENERSISRNDIKRRRNERVERMNRGIEGGRKKGRKEGRHQKKVHIKQTQK